MKTISIINLKGGVGKTISAINIAYILTDVYSKKVLLVDNDKQGNTSMFFNLLSGDIKTISDIMEEPNFNTEEAIYKTTFPQLDVIPANMFLAIAIQNLANEEEQTQQTRLVRALERVQGNYDYCIIDNPPDVNLSVINAFAATNDVLVPVKADMFSFDGLETIVELTESAKALNRNIRFKGCFLTMYQKNNINKLSLERLRNYTGYPVFSTVIRSSVKAAETTYYKKPLLIYSKNCNASKDYIALVEEYLSK